MSKVLVTGATGKVGEEVVKQLAAKGVAVRAAAHNPAKAQFLAGENVEIIKFDYNDTAGFATALEGVDKIYLMAPPTGDAVAIEKTLIDAAKQSGVKYIVKLSVIGAEYNDNSPLRQVEKYIEASGLPYTFLRPSWFFQNFSTSQADSIRNGAFVIPTGDGKVGFVDSRDIAAVGVAALTEDGHAGKAYTITGGEALDYYQVAAIFSKVLDKQIKYTPVSDEQFRAAVAGQIPPDYLELLSGLYTIIRSGNAATVTPTVQEVLGRAPITLEQFAHDYAEVWK